MKDDTLKIVAGSEDVAGFFLITDTKTLDLLVKLASKYNCTPAEAVSKLVWSGAIMNDMATEQEMKERYGDQ